MSMGEVVEVTGNEGGGRGKGEVSTANHFRSKIKQTISLKVNFEA